MELMDDIIKEFLVESYENLDQLDQDLLALEEIPDDRDCMSRVFRTIHTIKGTSGFLAFDKLQQVTHVGENLLVPLRDGELKLNREIANTLLAMVDAIRGILQAIEETGLEGNGNYTALIERLESLRHSPEEPALASIDPESLVRELTSPVAEPVDAVPAEEAATLEDSTVLNEPVKRTKKPRQTKAKVAAPAKTKQVATKKAKLTAPKRPAKAKASQQPGRRESSPLAVAPAVPTLVTRPLLDKPDGEYAVMDCSVTEPKAVSKSPTAASDLSLESESSDRCSAVSDSSVRIDVHLLDKLMNLVGELVLARNQILQFGQSSDDPAVVAASQRLNLITTELQEGVMKTRMQPIRNAWNKLPRVVRDLAQSCGKEVQVKMEGADTELDKTILEAIRDPLTHIVRNSVDHGLESPLEREAAGKPREGTLSLRAFHEGGHVIIEIADDGAGIRLDRVRAKAIERGLASAEQASTMSDREATQLILLPGFSTAAQVSNVSGRGVGMDVVKTNVEKIGGSLDIQSAAGVGTTLRIKIPLTLAIVPALIVTCEQDRFCIPQVNLQELVRLEGELARTEIEVLHSIPVYRLRGQLLPLIYLDEELGLRSRRTAEERQSGEAVNIVVLQADERQFGLVVDRITDTQEIVVKPMGQHLKGLITYAGSTIMGDGTVALILDVLGLAQNAKVLSSHQSRAIVDAESSERDQQHDHISFLVVNTGDGSRAAIPLSSVARLERIAATAIEQCGQKTVVQYRGEIMPLVSLSGYGGVDPGDNSTLSLVVYRSEFGNIGIVVSEVIDIVEHPVTVTKAHTREPQIIAGRVTQVIDPAELARQVL